MKKILVLLVLSMALLSGCQTKVQTADIAATTQPVYEFTSRLCQGTDLTVTQLVTENVSCLHDYALNVGQVKAVECAQLVVISGAGLEEFMEDILAEKQTIDASAGISLLESCHDHDHESTHQHEQDAHIWLSADNALAMATNISEGLCSNYPQYRDIFEDNLSILLADIQAVKAYGDAQLSDLSCSEIVTFHDGFAYFADSCGLQILTAIEEESGAEASAAELIEIIEIINEHHLTAIFTEVNGSVSAAGIISAETGAAIYTLDMAMSGSWFDAMYHNIDTIQEALG